MAATKLLNSELLTIDYQAPIYSRPPRTNFKTIQNHYNELYDRVNDLVVATLAGGEVTDARDYATVLKDRLQYASRAQGNVIVDGMTVTAQSTPDMTVQVSGGIGIVNGVLCYRSASGNTGTITAPTNSRYDIVCLNSDNTISVQTGNDSTDPVLPAISITQRPLAIIALTSSDTTITNSMITDCKRQGAIAHSSDDTVQWHWFIQSAVDAIDNDVGGNVIVFPGSYYEEVDISANNYLTLDLTSAKLYRYADGVRCLKGINTVSNETTGNKISGGFFFGNGRAGANELVKFDYQDSFIWSGSILDGNSSSTATPKKYKIENSENYTVTFEGSINVNGFSILERNMIFGG